MAFSRSGSESRMSSRSRLLISSIMPVSFPAMSDRCLATAGNSFSPIMYFCSDGRAAAKAATHRGAPGAWMRPL
eukprot:10001300-Lingulodinium_polyedra.AAC.1